MASKKDWQINRKELKVGPFGKLDNPQRIRELDELIEGVNAKSIYATVICKLTRKVIEEVTNILQHNKTWNDLDVQTAFNKEGSNYKIRIRYDGGQYHNPEDLPQVIGPFIGKLAGYKREFDIDPTGNVEIQIQIKLEAEERP